MRLDLETQRRICTVATEAEFGEPERRALLLNRIPPALAARLSVKPRLMDQLLSDVIQLARQRTDVGDSLVIWLENTCTLCTDAFHRRPLERLLARRRRAIATEVEH